MAQDVEAAMIDFYLLRGHTLQELTTLSTLDKVFYYAAMKKYYERVEVMADG